MVADNTRKKLVLPHTRTDLQGLADLRQQTYEAVVEPIVQQLQRLCEEHHMTCLVTVEHYPGRFITAGFRQEQISLPVSLIDGAMACEGDLDKLAHAYGEFILAAGLKHNSKVLLAMGLPQDLAEREDTDDKREESA